MAVGTGRSEGACGGAREVAGGCCCCWCWLVALARAHCAAVLVASFASRFGERDWHCNLQPMTEVPDCGTRPSPPVVGPTSRGGRMRQSDLGTRRLRTDAGAGTAHVLKELELATAALDTDALNRSTCARHSSPTREFPSSSLITASVP